MLFMSKAKFSYNPKTMRFFLALFYPHQNIADLSLKMPTYARIRALIYSLLCIHAKISHVEAEACVINLSAAPLYIAGIIESRFGLPKFGRPCFKSKRGTKIKKYLAKTMFT